MGAYVYLFPNAKLLVLVPFGILFPTTIKAKTFMYFWFISQIFIAIGSSNISWEAHIGGFLIGYYLLNFQNIKGTTFENDSITISALFASSKFDTPLLTRIVLAFSFVPKNISVSTLSPITKSSCIFLSKKYLI